MKDPGWKVIVIWPDGEVTRSLRLTTVLLKEFLDREIFCLRHECPLPTSVTISRVGQ